MPIEDVCRKSPVGAEPLSAHCLRNSPIVFCHVSDMVAVRIQDHVFIGLLKAEEDVHHLNLPLNHYA